MITLFTAECRQNNRNCVYPHRVEVSDEVTLKQAVALDYVCAEFRENRRSIDNFVRCDCLAFDVDNDHSDLPAEWILPKDVAEFFSGVTFWVHFSRSNMKEKNGKEPRPKFHVFFPIRECRSAQQCASLKQAVQRIFPYFDEQALDAARFFFGTEDPEVEYWEGIRDLTEFLEKRGIGAALRGDYVPIARKGTAAYAPTAPSEQIINGTTKYDPKKPSPGGEGGSERSYASSETDEVGLPDEVFSVIPAGERNRTMHRFAVRTLKHFGRTEAAWDLFMQESRRCDPPLPAPELRSIWTSAVRFFDKVIASSPEYIPPEEYHGDSSPNSLKPPDYSDLGQAKVIVREYKDELCYTESTDYLRYNGQFWRESKQRAIGAVEEFLDLQLADAEADIEAAMKELTEIGGVEFDMSDGLRGLDKQFKAFDDAEKLNALEEAKRRLSAALAYKSFVMRRRDMNYILSALAAAKPMVQLEVSDLDKDPFLLNTPDATYDLRSGIDGARAQEPRNYITKITAFNPSEKGGELWEEALDTFFCGDRELIAYVQQIVGLVAIGKVFLESIIISYGEGRNGKSTFWNTVSRVMGTYSGQMSADTLTVGVKRNVKPEMAELKGKRLVIAAELEEGMRLNTSMIKQLCSTDEIFAEKKYQPPFKFIPSHTLVLYTNHLPKVGASDAGTWRRLIVIPFHAKIEGSSDIKNYTDYLVQHAGEAVMRWIIEGARKVIAAEYRLEIPACVRAAVKAYRDSNDWLSFFLDECCEVNPDYREKSGSVYQEYRDFCMRNGEWARSTADFYTALDQAGFERAKKMNGVFISGLRLKITGYSG